jgi:hypothetical protein
MRYDVAHTAHFSKGGFRDGPVGCLGQARRSPADDFDAPGHGVLFFFVGAKIGLRGVFDLRADEPGGLQDVAQPADLVSFHVSTRWWPECARGRSDWAISPGSDARQNPQGGRPIPPPRPPFPITRRSRRTLIQRGSPTGLRHCWERLGRSRLNQRPQAGKYDVSRKTGHSSLRSSSGDSAGA